MSLVYDSSQIQANSRQKKKGNTNSDAKDEDHAFKGNNICNSLQFIHCHYLISHLI